MDKCLLPSVQECNYRSIVISDHAHNKLKINLSTTKPVYRPWRLNPLLLSDERISDFISSQIDLFLEINQTPNMSPSTVWEALKAYLRGQIISYNTQLRKTRNNRTNELINKIGNLDSKLATSPLADDIKERLLLQKEFDLLTTQKAENLLIRSQHVYYEHGDKTGRILAHQLRQKSV